MSAPKSFTPIHPFPARMDPVAAMDGLVESSGRRMTVLDSMMGSGSVPMLAALRGHNGYGFDLDPLALVLARALAQQPDERFITAAAHIQRSAREFEGRVELDVDDETRSFIDFWFDRQAQDRLTALAAAIESCDDDLKPQLWCAFSRLIITKDAGASRARDVSHSRPHVVRELAAIDPIERFLSSAEHVAARHRAVRALEMRKGTTYLERGDARDLPLADNSVDRVATSPPYLQAIDYLRGHRMTLVWMGHSIASLRDLRSRTIGSARGLATASEIEGILRRVTPEGLPARGTAILRRYVADLDGVIAEIARVLKPSGLARFVVADATLVGKPVAIEKIVRLLAAQRGLTRVQRQVRALPSGSRYLPPPGASEGALDRRIRVEQLITFAPG